MRDRICTSPHWWRQAAPQLTFICLLTTAVDALPWQHPYPTEAIVRLPQEDMVQLAFICCILLRPCLHAQRCGCLQAVAQVQGDGRATHCLLAEVVLHCGRLLHDNPDGHRFLQRGGMLEAWATYPARCWNP